MLLGGVIPVFHPKNWYNGVFIPVFHPKNWYTIELNPNQVRLLSLANYNFIDSLS